MNAEVSAALSYALRMGFQVHPSALDVLGRVDASRIGRVVRGVVAQKAHRGQRVISGADLEEALGIGGEPEPEGRWEVLFDPTPRVASARGVDGLHSLFASRYEKLRRIVAGRPEAKGIRRAAAAAAGGEPGDEVYVCGLVSERRTERGSVRVTLDDPSGSVEVAAFDEGPREAAAALVDDQMAMVRAAVGRGGGRALTAREIVPPDVPDREPGRSETDAHAAFVSDLHVGSKYFLEDEFRAFVRWLSEIDGVAPKVRFLVIGGDLLDGVGVYKDQERELKHKTLEDQLALADDILSGVPDRVRVFISPGNHDPGRRALPQPAIPEKHCPALWARGNVTMVGNPAALSLNGVRVLVFHGQSIDDVVKTVPGISYDRPGGVMRYLLRCRHLSPVYGAQTPLAPEEEDMMVIDEVPDILHTGHVHVWGMETYRGVLMVNSGTWQSRTPFQESVGIEPTPGMATLVNLRTMKPFVYGKD